VVIILAKMRKTTSFRHPPHAVILSDLVGNGKTILDYLMENGIDFYARLMNN